MARSCLGRVDGLWSILHLTVGVPFMYINVINLVWYCVLEFIRRGSPQITLSVFQSGMALITKLWRVFSLIRGSFRHLSFPANFPFSIPAYPKRPIYNKDLVTSSQCITFGMRNRPGSRPGLPSDIQRPANTRSVAGSVATASGRPSRRTTSSVLPVPSFAAWA